MVDDANTALGKAAALIVEDVVRPRIYVSGPLTSSGNPEQNRDEAYAIGRKLIELGFAPLVPHYTWDMDFQHQFPDLRTWLEVDLPWLVQADAVLRLPGDSRGADGEVLFARDHGIPVFATIQALLDYGFI